VEGDNLTFGNLGSAVNVGTVVATSPNLMSSVFLKSFSSAWTSATFFAFFSFSFFFFSLKYLQARWSRSKKTQGCHFKHATVTNKAEVH